MPIHEFSCSKCGKQFEELIFKNERPACPICGSHETSKLISASAKAKSGSSDSVPSYSGGGCGSCSGGNCASCGR